MIAFSGSRLLRTGTEKDLQYSFRGGAFHRMDAIGKRIFFAYQTLNIYSAFLQQVESWCESTTTRANYGYLVHNHAGRINFGGVVKSRFQYQPAFRRQEIESHLETRCCT